MDAAEERGAAVKKKRRIPHKMAEGETRAFAHFSLVVK